MTFRLLKYIFFDQTQKSNGIIAIRDRIPVCVFLEFVLEGLRTLTNGQHVHLATIRDEPLLSLAMRAIYVATLRFLVHR